jgi:S1-C subfamily serine protease
MRAFSVIAASMVFFLGSSVSAKEDSEAQELSPFEFTSQFTVKVVNQVAQMFTGQTNGGHGTGFLVEIYKNPNGEKIGVIFTNKHVVEVNSPNVVQNITCEFSTDTELAETVPCKTIYQSRINDFAVLEFKISDLKRVQNKIRPALIPPSDSPLYNFEQHFRTLQGRETLAQGNPLDSQSVTTYGAITGIYRDVREGVFIQTQTPINPGNSGGPLIDMQTGAVIGINTMKVTDADNVGYSLPIGVAMSEYLHWRKDSRIGRLKKLKVRWGMNPIGEMDVLGVTPVIKKAHPEFFNRYKAALRIQDAAAETNLKTGDQIVAVNGKLMPPSVYEMLRRLQFANSYVNIELVRGGKLITVKVPVEDLTFQSQRSRLDFVYLSGLTFYSIDDFSAWAIDHNLESRVLINQVLPTTETRFGAVRIPDLASLLFRVSIEGIEYPIKTITDLKRVLNSHSGAKFIRLDVREPVKAYDHDGDFGPVLNTLGAFVYEATSTSYVLPIVDFITPFQFSKNQFAKQFSFEEMHPETRHWRKFIRDRKPTGKSLCDVALSTEVAQN